MDKAAKIAAGLVAVVMILLWGQILISPDQVAATMHLMPDGAAGLNTFRADVGGLLLGAGLLSLLSLKTGQSHWLQAAALLMGCAALGRFSGIVLDGPTQSSVGSMIFELVLVAILFASATRFKKA